MLVDAAPASRAERVLDLLRESVGRLAVRPVEFARPVHDSLTAWLRDAEPPRAFRLGEWADLQHPLEPANKVRFRGQPLEEDDVRAALDRGLVVTALEVAWEAGEAEPLACVICEDGCLRRLRLPELRAEPSGASGRDGAADSEDARLEADLALVALVVDRFLDALVPALGGLAESAGGA